MNVKRLKIEKKDRRGKRRVEMVVEHDNFPCRYRLDVDDKEEKLQKAAQRIIEHHRERVKRTKDFDKKKRVLTQRDGANVILSDVRIHLLGDDLVRVTVELAAETGPRNRKFVGREVFHYSKIEDVPDNDALAAIMLSKLYEAEDKKAEEETTRAGLESRVRGRLVIGEV